MATLGTTVETPKSLIAKYMTAPEEEQVAIVEYAEANFSKNQIRQFKKGVAALKDPESDAEGGGGPSETSKTPATTSHGKTDPTPGKKGDIPEHFRIVTNAEMEKFWDEIDNLDPTTLIDPETIQAFQYVGFSPDAILRAVVLLSRNANRSTQQMMKDIANMCAIAAMKGSITDNNLKKMSDEGKRAYAALESVYALKRGGTKNADPSQITIARVAAAFPGHMMRLLMSKPELAKKFAGPFGSKVLPSYLRHQSAAAIIPESLSESAKSFLIGIITAFTSDQSKAISKSKDKAEELFDRQENFVLQTFSSSHPSEDVRKSLFRIWSLDSDYPKLKIVADNIVKVRADFTVISQQDLKAAISRI